MITNLNPETATGPGAAAGGWLHNMSAPPRSIVTFVPYGTTGGPLGGAGPGGACGLRRRCRAAPDAVLARELPAWFHELQAIAGDTAAAQVRRQSLRLAGLACVAAALAGERPPAEVAAVANATVELWHDRLVELAGRLPPPPPPELPAMALLSPADRSAGAPVPLAATLAALWILTRVNGLCFDRQGLARLAPGLAEGTAYDLYLPCFDGDPN